jgi:hypothetical protein
MAAVDGERLTAQFCGGVDAEATKDVASMFGDGQRAYRERSADLLAAKALDNE